MTAAAQSGGGLNRRDIAFFVVLTIYGALVLGILGMGVVAVIAHHSPSLHESLHRTGLSPSWLGRHALAMADASHQTKGWPEVALDYGFSMLNLALAGILLGLRPRDRTARFLAVGMIGTAAIFNVTAHTVYESLPATPTESIPHTVLHVAAAMSYLYALLLFPDGRLVPRWRASAQAALYVPATIAFGALAFRIGGTSRTVALILVFGFLTPITGVTAQAYRSRRPASSTERQQARLLFWALVPAFIASLAVLTSAAQSSAFQLRAVPGREGFIHTVPVTVVRVFQGAFVLVPIALVAGILRFRLWNVERLIRRTLLYAMLAVFVGLVYVGVVVGISHLIGTRSGSVWLSIVATGLVAVAFEPVKSRATRLANRLVYGKRATPYEVLSEVSERMAEAVATDEMLSRLARVVAEGTAARRAGVWLVFGNEMRPGAYWPPEAAPFDRLALVNGEPPPPPEGTTLVPVRHHGELLGVFSITKPNQEALSPTESKLLTDLSGQAGLVLRNVRLNAELMARLRELRASRQRLVAAQDEERRRLERNLHDGAQQQLVALKVQLGLAERLAEPESPLAELIQQLKDDTGGALETLRDLARGIYPPLLASEGLGAALRAQTTKVPYELEVVDQGIGRYPQDVESAVYFCALEAFQNAAKHAEATKMTVTLAETDGELRFEIRDNGKGFDPGHVHLGSGCQNMVDRIEALDGHLDISSRPGEGTALTGHIPLQEPVHEPAPPAPELARS